MDIEAINAFSEAVRHKLPPNVSLSWNADPATLALSTSCTLTAKRNDTQDVILEMTYRDNFPDKLNTNKAVDDFISYLKDSLRNK